MKKVLILALVAAAWLTTSLSATTVLYVPLQKSIQMSDAILVGHVLKMEGGYNRAGDVVTKVHLLVEETLKGSVEAGDVFVFDAWGGDVDGVHVEAIGEAKYRLGDKVLVQLEDIDGEFHTLGLSFGKWNVRPSKEGVLEAIRSLDDLHMVGVTEAPLQKIPLQKMRQVVRNPF